MDRLLIVEDDEGIRESLEDFFLGHEFLVTAVESAEAAQTALGDDEFSLIILDLKLPGMDGLRFLEWLRRAGHRIAVIVTTARGEEEQRIRGLRTGADDYLVKPFSLHELMARIHAILRRTSRKPGILRIGEATVDLDAMCIRRGADQYHLAAKEAELLAHFARNPGKSLSRQELLNAVWGYDESPTTRTVDTHVFNLRKKLEDSPGEPRHIHTIRGFGYRFDP